MERTLLMIKPDAVERRLVGEVVGRMERKGLKLVALEMQRLTRERAEDLYSVHQGKHFFGDLVEFITRGPIVALVLEGKDCIALVRKLMGATNPLNAEPGSIRRSRWYSLIRPRSDGEMRMLRLFPVSSPLR